jgi:hypothetical protein
MLTLHKPGRYVAYLLRCWAEQADDVAAPLAWRFSLEDPHTDRRRGFASLERLVAALAEECGGPTRAVESADASPSRDADRAGSPDSQARRRSST